MASMADRYLKQMAVLWRANGVDRNGFPTFAEPEDMRVRWTIQRVEERDPNGNVTVFDSYALLAGTVPLHSLMWLAPDRLQSGLDQWYEEGSAGHDDEVMQVANLKVIPNVQGTKFLYKALLNKFRDTVPAPTE